MWQKKIDNKKYWCIKRKAILKLSNKNKKIKFDEKDNVVGLVKITTKHFSSKTGFNVHRAVCTVFVKVHEHCSAFKTMCFKCREEKKRRLKSKILD